jgi:hypothetical protein
LGVATVLAQPHAEHMGAAQMCVHHSASQMCAQGRGSAAYIDEMWLLPHPLWLRSHGLSAAVARRLLWPREWWMWAGARLMFLRIGVWASET